MFVNVERDMPNTASEAGIGEDGGWGEDGYDISGALWGINRVDKSVLTQIIQEGSHIPLDLLRVHIRV